MKENFQNLFNTTYHSLNPLFIGIFVRISILLSYSSAYIWYQIFLSWKDIFQNKWNRFERQNIKCFIRVDSYETINMGNIEHLRRGLFFWYRNVCLCYHTLIITSKTLSCVLVFCHYIMKIRFVCCFCCHCLNNWKNCLISVFYNINDIIRKSCFESFNLSTFIIEQW